METASGPSRLSLVARRHRQRAEHATSTDEFAPHQGREEEERRHADVDEPLLAREQRGRTVMGEAHRKFHRRAAQEASDVLTVNVNVEQTVDSGGNVVGVATVTPALPVVPAVPTVGVPTVPTVPAFPSDLNVPTVPAYPYPSGTGTVSQPIPTPTPAPVPIETSSILPTTYSGFNSTSSCGYILSCQASQLTNHSHNIIFPVVVVTQQHIPVVYFFLDTLVDNIFPIISTDDNRIIIFRFGHQRFLWIAYFIGWWRRRRRRFQPSGHDRSLRTSSYCCRGRRTV